MNVHKKKLAEIAAKGSKPKKAGFSELFQIQDQERYFKNKKKIHDLKISSKFMIHLLLTIAKQQEIERDNQKLLKKLVEISAGR